MRVFHYILFTSFLSQFTPRSKLFQSLVWHFSTRTMLQKQAQIFKWIKFIGFCRFYHRIDFHTGILSRLVYHRIASSYGQLPMVECCSHWDCYSGCMHHLSDSSSWTDGNHWNSWLLWLACLRIPDVIWFMPIAIRYHFWNLVPFLNQKVIKEL